MAFFVRRIKKTDNEIVSFKSDKYQITTESQLKCHLIKLWL